MIAPRYFEDFKVGTVIEVDGPTVTESDIVEFAAKYDPQWFHVDPGRAKSSIYGGLIASGWHTGSLCRRMMCDAYVLSSASLGSPGLEQLRWLKPLRPDDRLRMRMTVIEARPSQSKPDRGTVLHRWEVFNQTGEKLMEMTGYAMFLKKPHE